MSTSLGFWSSTERWITGRGPGHSLEEGMLAAPTLSPAHSCTTETRPGVCIFSPWLSWVVRSLTKTRRSMVSHHRGGPLPETLWPSSTWLPPTAARGFNTQLVQGGSKRTQCKWGKRVSKATFELFLATHWPDPPRLAHPQKWAKTVEGGYTLGCLAGARLWWEVQIPRWEGPWGRSRGEWAKAGLITSL